MLCVIILWLPHGPLTILTQDLPFFRDGAGIAHAPQPLRRTFWLVKARDGRDQLHSCWILYVLIALRPFLDLFAVPCTARFVARTTRSWGTRPGRRGGECVWPQFRFFPLGWPARARVGEAPRFQAGAWVLTAPARIRGGTQGIANRKGCSCELQSLGGSFGAGPRQVFSCERPHGQNLSMDGANSGCPPGDR